LKEGTLPTTWAENSSSKNINLLNKKLRDEISNYLNEFMQKSRSL